MNSNLEKYKKDLNDLLSQGDGISNDLALMVCEETGQKPEHLKAAQEKHAGFFKRYYQTWYTEAMAVIKIIIPDRLEEFHSYYRIDPKRKSINIQTYKLQDLFQGRRSSKYSSGEKYFEDLAIAYTCFEMQLEILKAVSRKFESHLFDIKQLVQADLFDSELDAARELLKHKFFRGAGAVAGVVLEKHLAQVCENHQLSIKKGHSTISELNDLLKKHEIIELSVWRNIARLGSLRNLCDHDKKKEPTKEDVSDLIDGVDKIIKTLF